MPNNKAVSTKKKENSKKRWALWLIPVVALAGYINWSLWGGAMVEQSKMATYLKEKYGKEFVVEDYRVEGSGLGVEGDPTADAYPKDDVSLRFEIWDRGKFNIGQHVYSDSYLKYLWSKQAKKKVTSFIQGTFPESSDSLVSVGPIDTVTFEFPHGRTPHLEEALEKYGNQMFYSLSVKSAVRQANEEPSDEQRAQALKLFEFVGGFPVKLPKAYHLYRYPDFSQRDQVGSQRYQFSISAEGDVLRTVNAENIMMFYKRLR